MHRHIIHATRHNSLDKPLYANPVNINQIVAETLLWKKMKGLDMFCLSEMVLGRLCEKLKLNYKCFRICPLKHSIYFVIFFFFLHQCLNMHFFSINKPVPKHFVFAMPFTIISLLYVFVNQLLLDIIQILC